MQEKIKQYKEGKITESKLNEIYQGWTAYAKWANPYKLQNNLIKWKT